MKKVLCGLLSAAMLLTIAPASNCQASEDFYSNVVEEYVSDTFTVGSTGYTIDCSFSIPQINWEGEEISQVNADIRSVYEAYHQKSLQTSDAWALECKSVRYEWSVTDDILTLIIYASLYPDASGWTEPDVYSIDLYDARVLSKEDIYSYFGYEGDSYTDDVRDALGRTFCRIYGQAMDNGMANQDFTAKQLARTIADENVRDAIPYIDENGEMALKMTIYSLAAGDSYPHLATVSELEDSPYYTPITPVGEGRTEENQTDENQTDEEVAVG